MEKENLNDEDKPNASPSVQIWSEEKWCDLLAYDSAKVDGVARDCPKDDNVPHISQSGNFVADASSQINNHSNVMHHYPHEGDHQSLLHRPNSGFIDKQMIERTGSTSSSKYSANIDGVARDCPQNDNVPQLSHSHYMNIVPSVGNFAIDSSQINNHSNVMRHYPHKGYHQSLLHRPNSGFLSRHAPFNPNSVVGNVAVPPLDYNFAMPMFSPNQGAVSFNSPGMLDGRYLTSNSGSNNNAEVSTDLFGINVSGDSQRGSIPSLNANNPIIDSRRLPYPNFDINNAISGSQNNNNLMHVLPQNAGAWMHSTDNHYLRPSVRLPQPSLPSGINQIMQHQHDVFSSTAMVSNQPLYGQLPEFMVNSDMNNSLRSSASPLCMATGGMNTSNLGSQAEMKYMYDKALMPCVEMRYKRGASEPQSFLAQAHQRMTQMNCPLIPPSVPTWISSVCSIPHTTQRSFASSQKGIPFTPQATFSTVSLPAPTCPNTYLSAPSLPPQASTVFTAPRHANTIPLSLIGSQSQSQSQMKTISPPHQPQMTPSVPQSCSKRRCIKASKPKDEAVIKLSGIRCNVCNADLSYDPELCALTYPPPASRILQCGHAFHQFCLNSSCIACKALGIEGKNIEGDRKLH